MSYYQTVNAVNKEIAEILKEVATGKVVSVDLLVITLTEKYQIGETYVRKRINLKVSASELTGRKLEINEKGIIRCQI